MSSTIHIESRWDASHAANLDPIELLVYRSNLLGADPRITNYGGGNTSSKISMADPLTGEPTTVLWVKGSGGDLGSLTKSGLASLYQDRVLLLENIQANRGLHEDEIIPYYQHCIFDLNPTAPSIDTPLHACVPHAHVDHMHPDAIIAIAASENAESLTRQVFGDDVGFLPWKRPGFDLALQLRDLLVDNPHLQGVVLGKHGLINWGETQKECYERTIALINRAYDFFASHSKDEPPFSVGNVSKITVGWDAFLPEMRGLMFFDGKPLVAHVDTSEATLEFVNSLQLERLSELGTSCPDHFLRTKIWPMVLRDMSVTSLEPALAEFRRKYEAYYERCKSHSSPSMRNPNPAVVLIPGLGMVAWGKSKSEAKITADFYMRAIEVMRYSESVDRYSALPEKEAFDIEYWQLEEAKLKRMPSEKLLSRRIALITGAAQGIGRATAELFLQNGACVTLVDNNFDKLRETSDRLSQQFGNGNCISVCADVTSDEQLGNAFRSTISSYGGLDICVVCAGNARRGTIAETSDADFQFQCDLLIKGYFLTMRHAARTMIRQKIGGSIVVVASKNAVAVGSNAAMYSASKAFELHLMRTTAADLAPEGIRCNAVNPDAVLEGSGIWDDAWREQTAANLGIAPSELEEHYRKRSLLGVTVRPMDVAQAIFWLSDDNVSSRTTGCIIPVDGGIREGFLR